MDALAAVDNKKHEAADPSSREMAEDNSQPHLAFVASHRRLVLVKVHTWEKVDM